MRVLCAIATEALLVSSAAYSARDVERAFIQQDRVGLVQQDVYDPSNSKIGKIDDVLVSDGGKVNALVIGVGGFLGAGEKEVAVPFTAVKWSTKDNKKYLTMAATKDELKSAQGLKYDSDKTAWVPAK